MVSGFFPVTDFQIRVELCLSPYLLEWHVNHAKHPYLSGTKVDLGFTAVQHRLLSYFRS